MNFFEQQDIAQRNTKRLLFLLCLAVMSLIAITTLLFATLFNVTRANENIDLSELGLWQGITRSMSWEMFGAISLGVCAVIVLGSLYKLIQLSGGGRTVAEAMGGRLIQPQSTDADERKILNVVEEMAIASGSAVPQVYLLEDDAINAFAAGHTPQDAIIGITRGCISLLTREQLQGVIAHEFSHIFHGDMKLNMRLIALLNGILIIGLIGHFLVRSSSSRLALRSSKEKFPAGLLALGVGLIAIGYTGTFFGNLIKSAVSRQREFLADASAVKFTRNPEGIAGALKKIGSNITGSQLSNDHAAEFSHMYFGQGISAGFSQLMATHPPLQERIKRIEPRWDGKFLQMTKPTSASAASDVNNSDVNQQATTAFAQQHNPLEIVLGIDQVLETIGQPTTAHIAYAEKILHSIEQDMHSAAHSPWDAQALILGLLLDKNAMLQQQQWSLVATLYSTTQISALQTIAQKTFALAPALRLPLIELSLPALKQLSLSQYQTFKKALSHFISADQQVNMTEWCYYRILIHNLEPKKTRAASIHLHQLHAESNTLLSVLAYAGASTNEQAENAYNRSKTLLELNDTKILDKTLCTLKNLDIAINRLNKVKPLQKPTLLKALSGCISHDNTVTITEAELFRAIADALDCPVPPLLGTQS
jgi:Zn-dependent protease with chaperone function